MVDLFDNFTSNWLLTFKKDLLRPFSVSLINNRLTQILVSVFLGSQVIDVGTNW